MLLNFISMFNLNEKNIIIKLKIFISISFILFPFYIIFISDLLTLVIFQHLLQETNLYDVDS